MRADDAGRAPRDVSIIGTVGVPAAYGGFETLAENLVRSERRFGGAVKYTVYCSSLSYTTRRADYEGARLCYLPLRANGIWSVPYDVISMILAALRGSDTLLVLGVSGALLFRPLRALFGIKIICNIDGIEWRRKKWGGLASWFLRISERAAVRFADEVVADNRAIAEYVGERYSRICSVIAYGGDHALVEPSAAPLLQIPRSYALLICRIEPENNVEVVLEAWAMREMVRGLVVVGNWDASEYGRDLKQRYGSRAGIVLLDPIYDLAVLSWLRGRAAAYVHGHSAGGTNPSLVEAMSFGLPVFAFDCDFNRATTDGEAIFFSDAAQLSELVASADGVEIARVGRAMRKIAERWYTWHAVSSAYRGLF